MRAVGAFFLLVACIGVAQAITFPSLSEAVKQTPDLSMLTAKIDSFPSFANQVMATGFAGTLFAPMDSALKPIEKFAAMMLSNPSNAADMLGLFVVPGVPLTLSDLKDGMKLTTLNNQQVTVSVKKAADGQPIYYINQARIASGNIYAGGSIIHQMAGVIVAPSKQLLLNAALKSSGWSDSNPPATVDLSPNGREQEEVVELPAAEPAEEEMPAQQPAEAEPVAEESQTPDDITYEEHTPGGDDDLDYQYGSDTGAEPAQEAPVKTVPVTDAEATPATPATPTQATPPQSNPATPAPATPTQAAPAPAAPTSVPAQPAQQQQPSVPVPSTPQQQPDSKITLESGTLTPTTSTPGTTTSTPATTTTTTTSSSSQALPAAITGSSAPAVATPATTTTSGSGQATAKTTSASTSVVAGALAAVLPAALALLMLA